MSNVYQKRRIAVDDISWTGVASPIHAQTVTLKNVGTQAIKLRTDSADADTEDSLLPGWQDTIASASLASDGAYRFQKNEPFVFAQTVGGAGTILITAIR